MSVQEAAGVLGVTVEAVRGRIKRGTLEAEREADGSVYVWLDTDQAPTSRDQPATGSDQTTTSPQPDAGREELVEVLREQVEYLREQLEAERSANRENRRLLAAALERIPQLEAPRDEPRGPETASEEPEGAKTPDRDEGSQEGVQRRERSWWRRFFGFE